jgi:hypothetical protein
MPRGETRIYASLPTASAKQLGRTQIFHGLPAPIQRPSLTAADFASDARGPKTRLMPIEDLLKPAQGATSATRGWQWRLQMTRGRTLRLVVGLIAIALTGYASRADVRASTPPTRKPVPVIVAAPPPAPAKPPEETKPEPRKDKRASKAATPRRAGDQLAAGELARAAKTYEQLAASAPDDPVYAEAARILRLRASRRSP